jgi:hypothetical protein
MYGIRWPSNEKRWVSACHGQGMAVELTQAVDVLKRPDPECTRLLARRSQLRH